MTTVRIDALVVDNSPRLGGADQEHVRLLAGTDGPLPPITVHRPTMRVIDGAHRVHAARRNGRDEIAARLLDCDENAAFVLAVMANIAHGMPLSRADRSAAATRVMADHPQWSDRAVAAATGLSDKTVSAIRRRTTAESPQSNSRLGRDGRLRPLDGGHRRQRAAALLRDQPEAGLREVARATGLSVATVRDVRRRIDRGEDPLPMRYRGARQREAAPVPAGVGTAGVGTAAPASRTARRPGARRARRCDVPADRDALLATLRHDPSLKYSEAGRDALRWLHHHVVSAEEVDGLGRGLPDHWAPVVANVARGCASAWARFAEQLDQRADRAP